MMTSPLFKLLAISLILLGLSACQKSASLKKQPATLVLSATPPPSAAIATLQEPALGQLCDAAMRMWRCTTQAHLNPSLDMDMDFDMEDEDGEALGECACTIIKTIAPSTTQGPFKGAAILSIEGSDGFVGGSIDGAEHLAIETATGGWQHVGLLTNNYSPGTGGFFNEGTIENITFQAVATQELLVVHHRSADRESSYADNTVYEHTAQHLLVCAKLDASAQCIELGVGGEQRTSTLHDDRGTPEPPSSAHWSATATFTPDGKLKYALPSGQTTAPEYATKLNGEHSLNEVATIAAAHTLRVTPLR